MKPNPRPAPKAKKPTAQPAVKSRYRVYIGQVNQYYVEVGAFDAEAAKATAYRTWRRTLAHAPILAVDPIEALERAAKGKGRG